MIDEKDCQRIQELLSEYLDLQLSPSKKEGVEVHLRSCSKCQKKWKASIKLKTWMKETPSLTPPESFYTQVMRKINEPPMKPFFIFRPYILRGLATASVLVLAVLIVKQTGKAPLPLMKTTSSIEEMPSENMDDFYFDTRDIQASLKDLDAGRIESKLRQKSARIDSSPAPILKRGMHKKVVNREKQFDRLSTQDEEVSLLLENKKEQTRVPAETSLKQTNANSPSKAPFQTGQSISGERKRSRREFAEETAESQNEPVNIQRQKQWSGYSSGVSKAKTVVIRNIEGWAKLRREHTALPVQGADAKKLGSYFYKAGRKSSETLPEVDFNKSILVAVFSGTKPTGGYAVKITSVYIQEDRMIVEYQEIKPPADIMVTQALTQPYHILSIPKTDLPIEFRKIPLP